MAKQSFDSLGVYRRLLSYVKPYKFAFILAICGNLLYGAVDAGFIKLFQPLLDKGFVDKDQLFIKWIPFVIIAIFILRGAANFMSTYYMGWVGRNVVMNLRQKLFNHLLVLPTKYYDKTTSGELLAKITYNVEQVADASADAITVLIRESFTAICLLLVMLSISWQLTLLFLFMVPLMAGIMHFVSKYMRKTATNVQNSVGSVTHVAEEAIEGQKVVKAFGGQDYEIQQFAKATDNNRKAEMKLIVTSALSIPTIQIIGSVVLAFTVYLATLNEAHTLGTAITPGAFAAMIAAMIALLKPIKQLTKVNTNIQKGIAGAASIFSLLDVPSEKDTGTTHIGRAKGLIEFQNVQFSYGEDKQTLSDINFTIQPGETVAIVGRSGSGKSTLVNLLPRFYDAEGTILLDGINIHDIPLTQLRAQVSLVSQQVTLFNDTVFNNIAYGLQNYTREDVIEAAISAHALEFIEELPQGLDTVVGENGVRLSGGQRQRLAIARAIMKKAPILILDEATSALDTESERKIQEALNELMAKSTTLVIAHRLSTIENSNRIMVVDQGKVIEAGTHHDLMRLEGVYAQLRVLQYQQAQAG